MGHGLQEGGEEEKLKRIGERAAEEGVQPRPVEKNEEEMERGAERGRGREKVKLPGEVKEEKEKKKGWSVPKEEGRRGEKIEYYRTETIDPPLPSRTGDTLHHTIHN